MKKLLSIIFVVMLAVSLVGCADKLKEGEITELQFTPAHTETHLLPMVISTGKTCMTMMMPYVVNYDDDYAVTIKAYVDGEKKTATYHITKEVYDKCQIGGMFVYDENHCSEEATYTKERAAG